MESKFETYPEYKDSGVEWLGVVPESWQVENLKSCLKERNESNKEKLVTDILSLCMYRGVIPYAEKGNSGNKAKEDLSAYKIARFGDIVLNSMNVVAGSVGLSKYTGVVSPVYYMLFPRYNCHCIRYFNYIFQNPGFQNNLTRLGSGILVKKSESTGKLNTIRMRIPMSKLNKEPLPIPPQDEQIAIANFLDEKVGQIDAAIAQKEQLIELINERKQIIIQNAVTKGIDPMVKMKNSGIDWIGDIPEHWNVEKGKWIFDRAERPVRKSDQIVTCFRDGEVTLRSNRRTQGFTNALKEHGYQGIRKGDLVIHAMDAFAGAIGVSDSDGKSTPVYSACLERIPNTVDVYYYAYFLRNMALTGFIESLAKGIRERSTDFRFADFRILMLLLPPRGEQTAIANFLDDKIREIDQSIKHEQLAIEKLKEYKATLINSAVTGKIKVS